jgi:hypothetical protein
LLQQRSSPWLLLLVASSVAWWLLLVWDLESKEDKSLLVMEVKARLVSEMRVVVTLAPGM